MFERFTVGSRRVVVLAQDEARELKHASIGTEHLLLGLLAGADDVVMGALDGQLTLEQARDAVTELLGAGDRAPTGHIPFTRRAKKVLELSLREALQHGHRDIHPGHVLLGLLREGEGYGAKVLADAGIDFAALRSAVVDAMGGVERAGPSRGRGFLRTWRRGPAIERGEDDLDAVLGRLPTPARAQIDAALEDPPPSVVARAQALAAALDPNRTDAGTAHLLAVLLSSPADDDGPTVAGALLELGVEPGALRRQVLGLL